KVSCPVSLRCWSLTGWLLTPISRPTKTSGSCELRDAAKSARPWKRWQRQDSTSNPFCRVAVATNSRHPALTEYPPMIRDYQPPAKHNPPALLDNAIRQLRDAIKAAPTIDDAGRLLRQLVAL